MARRKKQIPEYGTVMLRGVEYYRTRVEDADGKRVALYARTPEELYDKVQNAKKMIKEAEFRRATPTVRDYCEKWLQMKASQIRFTTMNDYRSKVKNYIIAPLGDKYLSDVTADDIKLALCLPAECCRIRLQSAAPSKCLGSRGFAPLRAESDPSACAPVFRGDGDARSEPRCGGAAAAGGLQAGDAGSQADECGGLCD